MFILHSFLFVSFILFKEEHKIRILCAYFYSEISINKILIAENIPQLQYIFFSEKYWKLSTFLEFKELLNYFHEYIIVRIIIIYKIGLSKSDFKSTPLGKSALWHHFLAYAKSVLSFLTFE